jgi:hypothetical protein
MKRIYKKPETTVVAVAPVKLLEGSPTPPTPPINPEDNTGDSFSRPVIPSDDLWEE